MTAGFVTDTRRLLARHLCQALVGGLLLGIGGLSWATPVTLNLKDADINALIASVSEITGRNFIVDPRVKGRVSLVSARPMEENEIYDVFLAILAVHGYAAIPGDKVIKIVPAANAKQDDVPTVDQRETIAQDQVVTRVIELHNISAAQLVPILRPLIPPQGHLAAYGPTNVLIVSDAAGNVDRIATIVARVDLASSEEVEIVPLRHASATDVVRVLSSLSDSKGQAAAQGAAAAGNQPKLVADERTNSVLLSGSAKDRLRLRTLIAHLDTPLEGGGDTQVIYLRYAKAVDLVPVLQGVSQNLNEEGKAPGQTATGAAQAVISSRAGAAGRTDVNIQADEATNSLVVTAPPDIVRSLRSVIAQLDVRRAQVLVEAAIAEISAEKTAELGVQWVVDGSQGGNLVGFTNFTLGQSLTNIAATAAAIADGDVSSASNIGSGMALGVGDFSGRNRFAAIISALSQDGNTNVLSTPTLVTMDNEEAEIIVGENRPFVTGSYTTTGDGSSNPFQTIERRDVGLTLRIKPQINEGNAVQLEISQDVEDVIADTAQGPTTTKRSIKTNVLVEDGQILVLGGLIDDSLNENVQKVPGLGDVPLLGNLFRYRKTVKEKRNLMIFLHPVILRDPVAGSIYTNDKYSYIRDQQIAARQKGVALLPEVQSPVLKTQQAVRANNSLIDTTPPPQPLPKPKSPPAPQDNPGFNNK
ncbi:MAG: type II secretion system secretin GspD [Gammaproteobacteria bacterium]|nr:type II secretion system secretin GspD [Gammaproteobacteria bacterium]MCP5423623.1 type II secretion system secretin GspD [Gammaproteobacteria bacterium]